MYLHVMPIYIMYQHSSCIEYPVLECVSFNFRHSKTEQSVPDLRPGKQLTEVPIEIHPLPMDDFDTQ